MKKTRFIFFALAAAGTGISGSDRIFMEFARRWSKSAKIDIYVWTEGRSMIKRNNLANKNISYHVSKMEETRNLGFFINYFARIAEGLRIGITLKFDIDPQDLVLYSASEFWMDSLPCFILKLRYPKSRWVASWYQTAPNPLQGFSGGRHKVSAFYYWFMQLPIKPLIARFSDFVLVNNDTEKKQFPKLNRQKRTVVVLGAVDLVKTDLWKKKIGKVTKKYDAVFQGRFHPQKGIVELIDIWSQVVRKKPNATLALIGDGPLMEDVRAKVQDLGIKYNVEIFGYLFDGEKKYKVFAQSKLVVHPAYYDSGGMASAEAMAFGIPCVGFDLPAYKSYYPKGMLKVKPGNIKLFAGAISKLLGNKQYYKKISRESLQMIRSTWSWDRRADEVFSAITKI